MIKEGARPGPASSMENRLLSNPGRQGRLSIWSSFCGRGRKILQLGFFGKISEKTDGSSILPLGEREGRTKIGTFDLLDLEQMDPITSHILLPNSIVNSVTYDVISNRAQPTGNG